MSKSTDWFPNAREDVIRLAKTWVEQFEAHGAAWGIPAAEIADFKAATAALDALFQRHKDNETRTPVGTQELNDAFRAQENRTRELYRLYIRDRRSDAERVALDLNPMDHHRTPTGAPTAQVTGETFLRGRHELGIRMVYLTGGPEDRANKGYRIYYRVLEHGQSAPASPEELVKSFFTKRKKDYVPFNYEDSGKTVWMAIQVENDGKKGPWGPLFSAVIP
ncbi:MAG: hypothetical protein LBG84_04065 [Treponema sp.]|jgi:hypothetical protein|nr:hypothetical protein [Treponema sp.]